MKFFLDKATNQYKFKVNENAKEVSLTKFYKDEKIVEESATEEAIVKAFTDRADNLRFIFENRGADANGVMHTLQDAFATPDAPWMLPKLMVEYVLESIEPQLMITSLMQKIQYTPGQRVLLPMTGALSQTNLDMVEGDEYPEAKMTFGDTGFAYNNIGKVGLAVKITEEMLRYSQFDIIGLHLKEAGKMLGRHKETKALNLMALQGITFYDNLNPAQSVLGVTHGRDRSGAGNGSIIADDFLDAEAHLIAKGFMPNTLIVHPLSYNMFRKDPVMRTLFFSGLQSAYFGAYRGNPAGGNPWKKTADRGLGKQQNIKKDTDPNMRNFDIDSAPVFPSYFGVDLQVLVTPHVRYDVINNLTDFILCDRNELGVLLEDEALTTEEWTDPARDIKKIKYRERYSFGLLNEGQSVVTFKNIKNVPNMIIDKPAEPMYEVSVTLTELDPKTPVVTI